jgi:pimeloyl-ACP methyl ester carboxylesterase
MARKEFNVDERRTYLMGHSMGGAGTLYLGSKYASNWAAIVAIAPAARRMEAHMDSILTKLTMPVLVVQGDADRAVPVENTRKWIAAMKARKMGFKYDEIPGGDHGSVIATGMPDIFVFFNAHTTHGSLNRSTYVCSGFRHKSSPRLPMPPGLARTSPH